MRRVAQHAQFRIEFSISDLQGRIFVYNSYRLFCCISSTNVAVHHVKGVGHYTPKYMTHCTRLSTFRRNLDEICFFVMEYCSVSCQAPEFGTALMCIDSKTSLSLSPTLNAHDTLL